MVREFPKKDWKLFRRLHSVALERFCRRVIEEVNQATSNCTENYHQRYVEVFSLLRKRDKELELAFDDSRPSNAFAQLANIKEARLLTDEEFAQFSPDTREAVELILELRSR